MVDDPYASLGLTKAATAADIKKAYRRLVRAHHPDLHPDDAKAEVRFKAVSAAHDLLKDPVTRARFDAGEIDATGAERPPERAFYRDYAGTPDNPYQQGQRFDAGDEPSDLFAHILRQHARGGATRGRGFAFEDGAASGPDLRFTLSVPFLDAARGARTAITLPDGAHLDVRIPRGLQDGQTLRLRGKGGPGYNGGPAGDALITVTVQPHPVFRREGDDIVMTLPITIDEAVLGARVAAPTVDGSVTLTIPKGTSSGRVLRLRGRGIRHADDAGAGDQRVEVRIVAPPGPDAALAAFLDDWRKTSAHDPRAGLFEGIAE